MLTLCFYFFRKNLYFFHPPFTLKTFSRVQNFITTFSTTAVTTIRVKNHATEYEYKNFYYYRYNIHDCLTITVMKNDKDPITYTMELDLDVSKGRKKEFSASFVLKNEYFISLF